MSSNDIQTIYELVDEICARDFPILAKLTDKSRTKFVDVIYDDILNGDNPEQVSEQDIFDHIEQVILQGITKHLDDFVEVLK
jgi:hypothetical protein|tara:strand:+ start:636 stop:881 length:246 start_codon:yes stop_codon:yes gene_type:complete